MWLSGKPPAEIRQVPSLCNKKPPLCAILERKEGAFYCRGIFIFETFYSSYDYHINVVFLTANMASLGDSEFILTIFGAMARIHLTELSQSVMLYYMCEYRLCGR